MKYEQKKLSEKKKERKKNTQFDLIKLKPM